MHQRSFLILFEKYCRFFLLCKLMFINIGSLNNFNENIEIPKNLSKQLNFRHFISTF